MPDIEVTDADRQALRSVLIIMGEDHNFRGIHARFLPRLTQTIAYNMQKKRERAKRIKEALRAVLVKMEADPLGRILNETREARAALEDD